MITISRIEPCKKNQNRINLYSDEGFLFAVYLESALAHKLGVGVTLEDALAQTIIAEDSARYAMSTAMSLVSRKMRTTSEIQSKLRAKGLSPAAIAQAVDKLIELGYLNDAEYARLYANDLFARYGEKVVEQKLLQKGLDRDLVRETLREIPQTQELIDTYLQRFLQRYDADEPYKKKQKCLRALLAKGFSYDDALAAWNRTKES